MRKRGKWLHLLDNAAITAVVFLVVDALLGSGYTLLLKQGNWEEYVRQVNWFNLLWWGFIVGFSIGSYSWSKQEEAFEEKQS